MSNTVDIYQKVTDLFIERIEAGVTPWRKTWSLPGVQPQNYFTKKEYRGINLFLLGCSPYALPFFCTFNQVKANKGTIRKGAKSLPVIYWNVVDSKSEFVIDENGNKTPKKQFFIKYYNVFNISDVDGIDFEIPEIKLTVNDVLEQCETIVSNMPNAPRLVNSDLGRAFYSPLTDKVNMPTINQFDSSEAYYATLFHELVHSTGHSSRLNREGITAFDGFGSHSYSKEELVAELGASYLSNFAGILNETLVDNSAAYLKGWLKPLKEDKKFIFWAAKEAQKAAEFICPRLNEPEDLNEE